MANTDRHLPPIEGPKKLHIFRNGDSMYPGKMLNFNKKKMPSFDSFLTEITNAINPRFGAVRKLYTPHGTRKIQNFDELDKCGVKYVAAGQEKFVRIDYLNIDEQLNTRRKPTNNNREIIPVKHSRIVVSGRIKKVHNIPIVIFVHPNGNDLEHPHRVRLSPRQQSGWELVLSTIADTVRLRYGGAIRRLYTTDGQELHDVSELDNGVVYVAVNMFNKFIHCHYGGVHSMSSNASSPRSENRRNNHHGVKLTPIRGDKKSVSLETPVSSTSSQQSRPLVGLSQTLVSKKSVMSREDYAAPTKAPNSRKNPPRNKDINFESDRDNVYKSKSTNRATHGAQEVPDSRFTRVELPIDQRKAEEVQEEDIPADVPDSERTYRLNSQPKVAEIRTNPVNSRNVDLPNGGIDKNSRVDGKRDGEANGSNARDENSYHETAAWVNGVSPQASPRRDSRPTIDPIDLVPSEGEIMLSHESEANEWDQPEVESNVAEVVQDVGEVGAAALSRPTSGVIDEQGEVIDDRGLNSRAESVREVIDDSLDRQIEDDNQNGDVEPKGQVISPEGRIISPETRVISPEGIAEGETTDSGPSTDAVEPTTEIRGEDESPEPISSANYENDNPPELESLRDDPQPDHPNDEVPGPAASQSGAEEAIVNDPHDRDRSRNDLEPDHVDTDQSPAVTDDPLTNSAGHMALSAELSTIPGSPADHDDAPDSTAELEKINDHSQHKERRASDKKSPQSIQDEAATTIQAGYRGYTSRKTTNEASGYNDKKNDPNQVGTSEQKQAYGNRGVERVPRGTKKVPLGGRGHRVKETGYEDVEREAEYSRKGDERERSERKALNNEYLSRSSGDRKKGGAVKFVIKGEFGGREEKGDNRDKFREQERAEGGIKNDKTRDRGGYEASGVEKNRNESVAKSGTYERRDKFNGENEVRHQERKSYDERKGFSKRGNVERVKKVGFGYVNMKSPDSEEPWSSSSASPVKGQFARRYEESENRRNSFERRDDNEHSGYGEKYDDQVTDTGGDSVPEFGAPLKKDDRYSGHGDVEERDDQLTAEYSVPAKEKSSNKFESLDENAVVDKFLDYPLEKVDHGVHANRESPSDMRSSFGFNVEGYGREDEQHGRDEKALTVERDEPNSDHDSFRGDADSFKDDVKVTVSDYGADVESNVQEKASDLVKDERAESNTDDVNRDKGVDNYSKGEGDENTESFVDKEGHIRDAPFDERAEGNVTDITRDPADYVGCAADEAGESANNVVSGFGY